MQALVLPSYFFFASILHLNWWLIIFNQSISKDLKYFLNFWSSVLYLIVLRCFIAIMIADRRNESPNSCAHLGFLVFFWRLPHHYETLVKWYFYARRNHHPPSHHVEYFIKFMRYWYGDKWIYEHVCSQHCLLDAVPHVHQLPKFYAFDMLFTYLIIISFLFDLVC